MAEAVKKSLFSVRTRFLRRTSTNNTCSDPPSSTASTSPDVPDADALPNHRPKKHARKSTSHSIVQHDDELDNEHVAPSSAAVDTVDHASEQRPRETDSSHLQFPPRVASLSGLAIASADTGSGSRSADHLVSAPPPDQSQTLPRPPTLLVQAPSSPELKADQRSLNGQLVTSNQQLESSEQPDPSSPSHILAAPSRQPLTRPQLTRTSTRGSYIGQSGGMFSTSSNTRPSTRDSDTHEAFVDAVQAQPRKMPKRKVWVRRPGASATLIPFHEDDLVDDVRDCILTKYANSLGKTFDSPDMTLKVQPRRSSNHIGHERTLGPEESVSRILDAYYSGGQDVSEALVIDVPQRRTPRVSPRIVNRAHPEYYDDHRPAEEDGGYFPPMPITGQLTPQGRNVYPVSHPPHSISILETGQAPALPSPREKRRPRPHRQHTSSPTVISPAGSSHAHQVHGHPTPRRVRHDSDERIKHIPAPPPMPASPTQEVPAAALTASGHPVGTPPAVSHPAAAAVSPRLPPSSATKKRTRKSIARRDSPVGRDFLPSQLTGDPDAQISVPPINVLIVEDNIINLKVLEMMVGKLKVRYATAMNGRDALARWREGGFHLVLMDIQLPIMSGLEATKEIRRLERINGIGVFAREDGEQVTVNGDTKQVNGHKPGAVNGDTVPLTRRGSKETNEADKLARIAGNTFKSPVIIVALTASSLQSDRREALAAGCNDFLTKPVNFTWFSQKVKEWGCMQALIDFDGWRAWKNAAESAESQKLAAREKESEEERVKREKREEKERRRMEVLGRMGKS
ncbi:MAG: hypothetical protein Q9159_007667 [Coniocarpon cinnabarinum]